MKTLRTTFLILVLLLFKSTVINAQSSVGEIQRFTGAENPIPQDIIARYICAKQTHDNAERLKVTEEIERYLPKEKIIQKDAPCQLEAGPGTKPPFYPDWYTNDVLVHSGMVAFEGNFKQIDLKQGEDGWMYLAVNRYNTGYNGYITVYRSSNGGANWTSVNGVYSPTAYYQSISMLVENRSSNNSNPDSTRILVYYTYSVVSNFQNAWLACVSFRRDGAAWYLNAEGPASGNKYEFPSACSDGMYWDLATYTHCIVREVTNGGTDVGLRHFLSTNWGVSHSSALITTPYEDIYPSAQYGEKQTGTDSIYIACERHINSTEYELRLHAIPEWTNSSNYYTYYISDAPFGVKYEKPVLTVVQQQYTLPRKMLITCTRNLNPRYFYSSNGAHSWTIDQLMGPNTTCQAIWTTCSSDSLTSGGFYVVMGYVSTDGDSLNIKKIDIPQTSAMIYYKKNSNYAWGGIPISTSICKTGNGKYASFAYAGSATVPTNVYYNAEMLINGINSNNGSIPEKYQLSQNYPNPFNPVTIINFSIPKTSSVTLVFYDVLGKEVITLVNDKLKSGNYKVEFDGTNYSSGIYYYRLKTDDYAETKKMILIK
jgi:hypothetical protein